MIILEKPYVSAPLVSYLEEKQIPVLHNDMAELLKDQGHRLNLLDDQAFVEQYRQQQKLYAVSRLAKKSSNDSDRLSKYLARFGLKFRELHDGPPAQPDK